jgi:hypothetical protein
LKCPSKYKDDKQQLQKNMQEQTTSMKWAITKVDKKHKLIGKPAYWRVGNIWPTYLTINFTWNDP